MLHAPCSLIIFASICAAVIQPNVSSELKKSDLLSDVRRLCPLSNICENNKLNDESKTVTGKISCCEDCSCEVNCSRHGNCCFPTEAEKVELHDKRKNQECIAPLTLDLLPTEYYKYRFYYMTTSCPDDKSDTNDCGNVRVAPWGSLFPIYSKSTGKIYKNRVCADCHGVHDGETWLPYMNCKQTDKNNIRILSVADNFDPFSYDMFSANCQIYFTFRERLNTEICFPDIIDTCNETVKFIPEMSEMATIDVAEACMSGFVSLFHFHHTYANVYCFLCNGGLRFLAENCFTFNTQLFGPPENDRTFTCLLDTKLLTILTDVNIRKDKEAPIACLKQAGDICVNVLCPSGKIYDSNFNCFHPALTWRTLYHVALRLKFDTELMNVSTLMALRNNRFLL